MRIKKHKLFLFIFDFLVIYTSFILAVWLKNHSGFFGSTSTFDVVSVETNLFPIFLILPFIFLAVFVFNNLYNYNVILYPTRSFVIASKSLLIGNIILVIILFILKYPLLQERWIILLNFFFMLFIISLFRILFLYFFLKFAISKKIIGKKLVIIGAGEFGIKMAQSMLENQDSYYTPIGFLDDEVKQTDLPISVLGSIQDINKHDKRFNEILIAINNVSYDNIHSIIENCKSVGKPIHIMSDLYGIVPMKKGIEEFDIFHASSVSNIRHGLIYKVIKRIIDITVALFFIIFFLPVWILIAIIIKVNSKGPVFYKQEVIGKNERPFIWYKFRTMVHNSDDRVHKLLIKDMATGVKSDGKKLQNDDRITSVGKVLRKFSIDEFLQLINVLRGEMSLVGPRPIADYEFELLDHWQKSRFKVIPGITGPWQVLGRNEVGFNDQLVLDRY
nr:exopolysaccharide biosynthesis polyprenyl glycosylphosphotransferase [Bacteroidota bacterium]